MYMYLLMKQTSHCTNDVTLATSPCECPLLMQSREACSIQSTRLVSAMCLRMRMCNVGQ